MSASTGWCEGVFLTKKGENRPFAPLFTDEFIIPKFPAVASAAAVPAASAATAAAAVFHRLGLVDDEGAAVELAAVQSGDRFLRLVARAHLDEAEAPRLAGEFIRDHLRRPQAPVRREDFLEAAFRNRIRQTADV